MNAQVSEEDVLDQVADLALRLSDHFAKSGQSAQDYGKSAILISVKSEDLAQGILQVFEEVRESSKCFEFQAEVIAPENLDITTLRGKTRSMVILTEGCWRIEYENALLSLRSCSMATGIPVEQLVIKIPSHL